MNRSTPSSSRKKAASKTARAAPESTPNANSGTDLGQITPDGGLENVPNAPELENGVEETNDDSAADGDTDAGADLGVEVLEAPVSSAAYREFETTFARWKQTDDPALRHQLILMYRNLVVSLARRFLERGEMFDDIVQQGIIGLIYALDHFDPARGVRFTTFATPAILGEIRRYFRDKSWGIRVPRRMQELHQVINRSMEQLTQQYDRAPTYAEIANALNLSVDDVIEVVEMAHSVDPMSLDEHAPTDTGYNQSTLGDTLGENDPELQKWHDWAPLQAALESLPERQRRVMHGIYFEGRSQVEIARDLNVSQMYVSRAQRRALAKLKEILREGEI